MPAGQGQERRRGSGPPLLCQGWNMHSRTSFPHRRTTQPAANKPSPWQASMCDGRQGRVQPRHVALSAVSVRVAVGPLLGSLQHYSCELIFMKQGPSMALGAHARTHDSGASPLRPRSSARNPNQRRTCSTVQREASFETLWRAVRSVHAAFDPAPPPLGPKRHILQRRIPHTTPPDVCFWMAIGNNRLHSTYIRIHRVWMGKGVRGLA